MKSKALRIFTSLLLIVSMQLGAVGTNVSIHYCGDVVMDMGFNEDVESCCPIKADINHETTIKKASCCSLESFTIDGISQVSQVQVEYSTPFLAILPLSFSFASPFTFEGTLPQALPHSNAPPISGRMILVWQQRFTI